VLTKSDTDDKVNANQGDKMSHSHGAVRFGNGDIFYIEFNGTVDVCLSNLYKSPEEVQEHWREQKWKHCNHKPVRLEPIEIAVEYGGGWYWNGFACKECMVITDRCEPFDPASEDRWKASDGLPEWYPDREKILEYFK